MYLFRFQSCFFIYHREHIMFNRDFENMPNTVGTQCLKISQKSLISLRLSKSVKTDRSKNATFFAIFKYFTETIFKILPQCRESEKHFGLFVIKIHTVSTVMLILK